ncbi:Hypothetical predicted protein [Mytilus galloprovincialis]|uniref:Uncharacterized protein n=1 Tax=Mytilus galloprovincialis TaxID=29158 RepID=A0A8B6BG35_MYTGA|nr:Hypothetical predicted protein [Mytilus galloprovincialis]
MEDESVMNVLETAGICTILNAKTKYTIVRSLILSNSEILRKQPMLDAIWKGTECVGLKTLLQNKQDNENQNDYTCTERAIVGTWCTLELNLARSKGYKIQEIYEVYHFQEHRTYNPRTGKGGLFDAILQEASGFPEECRMEQRNRIT